MELKELRIQRKRIRVENKNNPSKHALIVLPLHPEELEDIITTISGYNEYGPNPENIISFYPLGNVTADIREENRQVTLLSASVPEYQFGTNPKVVRENGEVFTGRTRKKGKVTKPMPLSRIQSYLQTYFVQDNQLVTYYAALIMESWTYCHNNRIVFEFGYGIGRELFFLPTLTEEESSGILIRAEDVDFYHEKHGDNPSYLPRVEILYGNLHDGYDVNLSESLLDKEEFLAILREEQFEVPLSKSNKLKA